MSERSVKLHIGLTRAMQERIVSGGDSALDQLARDIGITCVKSEGLKGFGILTCEADVDQIQNIGSHEGVEFVEEDGKRSTR